MKGTVSVSQAIRRGLLVVNGPVFALLVGPLALFAALVEWRFISKQFNWVGLPVFLASFILAWLWWSFSVPRWRLWAFERVEDIATLKHRAVAVGLTWPDGHAFERTEFKPSAHAARERQLDPSASDRL
jgi:hypothetical protein